ncbi:MAG: TonB-dependent receptor plug domain-containing protein [Deltaproteobacteria bacterium]|nr:TonB-dependent receptor plug domain-containing protein [Deltaproteobacteria bacterium]
MKRHIFSTLFLLLILCPVCMAEGASPAKNHTMLMFVGEDLGVLTIASRREEGAWGAPAVATVIDREDLLAEGRSTLAEALSMAPGFYMAGEEGGSRPYLRGIPNSVLFLYDTMNLCSDLSKGLHPLDYELSMAPVKRIEIIRGPGSVLWGPDAFAGLVNVVPLSGRDFQGMEGGLVGGSPDSDLGAYLNLGHDGGRWDGFFSISTRRRQEDDRKAQVLRFFGDGQCPVPPSGRYGSAQPDSAQYVDTYARFGYRNLMNLSAKASYYKRPYAMFGEDEDLGWLEERTANWGYVKLEGGRNLGHREGLRFAASYQWLEPDLQVIDKTLKQKEHTWYAELVYDKSLWRCTGLLTAGASYRRRRVENAPVWEAYLPDFLGPDNTAFLPRITEASYSNRLGSLFAQYLHKKGSLDFVFGLRYDHHDPYRDHLSYNTGVVWSEGKRRALKLFYGTAYRTPFSRQLLEESSPELEKITSLSAQLAIRPARSVQLTVTGFRNRVENHIMEDPYAGLSEPNSQTIDGVELEGKLLLVDSIELGANLTVLDNDGPDETYRLNDYSYISPDGEVVKHYIDVIYPFDSGPDSIGNLWVRWSPTKRVSAFIHMGLTSSHQLIAPRNQTPLKVEGGWLVDGTLTLKEFPVQNTELSLVLKNMTNREYRVEGTYSLRDAPGVSMQLWLRKTW